MDLFQASDKLNMILNIWRSGYGVISLHVFHNIIPVEAYTREACMIEALGICLIHTSFVFLLYRVVCSWPI